MRPLIEDALGFHGMKAIERRVLTLCNPNLRTPSATGATPTLAAALQILNPCESARMGSPRRDHHDGRDVARCWLRFRRGFEFPQSFTRLLMSVSTRAMPASALKSTTAACMVGRRPATPGSRYLLLSECEHHPQTEHSADSNLVSPAFLAGKLPP